MRSSMSGEHSAFKALGRLRLTRPTRPSVPDISTLTNSREGSEDMGRANATPLVLMAVVVAWSSLEDIARRAMVIEYEG